MCILLVNLLYVRLTIPLKGSGEAFVPRVNDWVFKCRHRQTLKSLNKSSKIFIAKRSETSVNPVASQGLTDGPCYSKRNLLKKPKSTI